MFRVIFRYSSGIVASIIRLTVTVRVTVLTDGTWDSADIAMWAMIESGCYLIASCLPVLRPMYMGIISQFAEISRRALESKRSKTTGTSRATGDEEESAFAAIQLDSFETARSHGRQSGV